MELRWWERDPARLESELQELDAAGFRYVVDEDSKRAGHLKIDVFPEVEGEEVHVVAFFPDLYPWFRFEVKAPDESLGHHQHPFAKTLCLMPRDTGWWRPETDRLAHLLRDKLATVLQSGAAEAPGEVNEERQGEPFTDYYVYAEGAMVFVDGQWTLPAGASYGSVVLGLEAATPGRPQALLRAAVLELRDDRGAVTYDAPAEIRERFTARLDARWTRLDAAPKVVQPDKVFEALKGRDRHAAKNYAHQVQGGSLTIRVGLFPEEHRWRGNGDRAIGQGWLVACELNRDHVMHAGRGKAQKRKPPTQYYLARIGRFTPQDVVERAPELRPLRDKVVAVVGLGCNGAPSAFEFARTGIAELRGVDHDFVDPGTCIRWPRGLTAAGWSKARVLDHEMKSQYPFTRFRFWSYRLGNVNEGQADDWQFVEELFADLDLLYDASAEPAVQYFLADQARRRGVPFISIFGTQGGWGGTIVRIRPARTMGCWLCYLYATAVGDLPSPPHADDAQGRAQPTGCADPTFIGAGFDLAQIAITGSRVAISTLSEGHALGYPPFDWDVGVLSLRDATGRAIAPTWSTHPLTRHAQCPACALLP